MEPGTPPRPPRTWFAAALLAFSLLAGVPAILDAGPPSFPPIPLSAPPSSPPPPPFPSPSTFTLDNGLRVHLRPMSEAPWATQILLFTGGSDLDPGGTSDGVHLLEHLFLYVGSATRSPRKRWPLGNWKDLSLSGVTFKDRMIVRWTCPPERLETEMAEVAGRFRGLQLDDATWKQEWSAVYQQIKDSGDDREKRFFKLSVEDVRTLESTLIRPDRAILCVTGAFDPMAVEKRIRETYGSIPKPFPGRGLRPPLPGWFPLAALRTEEATSRAWDYPRIRVSFRSPGPFSKDFPAFLAAVARIEATQLKSNEWTFEWPAPLAVGQVVLESKFDSSDSAEEVWSLMRDTVEKALAPPPDKAELLRARTFARHYLGLDNWFARLDMDSMEAATEFDAEAIWRGVDRESLVNRMADVSPDSWASALKHWTGYASSAATATLPPPPPSTEWATLPNGLRVGVYPTDAECAGVALLLPFGRDNGPSPVVARLFAHGLTPGRDVSHWTVRSGRDCTVLWWEGDRAHLVQVLGDLVSRLQGIAPSEEDLSRETAALAEPDPYPEPRIPAAMSTALLEGARSVSGRPREEAPPPATPAEAADQISAWCNIRSARVVISGVRSLPKAMARFHEYFGRLPAPGVAPAPPAKEPLPPFLGLAPDAKGIVCRAYALPPTSSKGSFVTAVAAALFLENSFRAPQSGHRLPEATFDFLMDPGVIVFTTPHGRRPEPTEYKFEWVRHYGSAGRASSYPPGRNAKRVLGSRLGVGPGGSSSWINHPDVSSLATAVRIALLDFREVDVTDLGLSLDSLTPEAVLAAGRELQKVTPVEFRVPIDSEE